jgi:hypothetical protein
MKSVIILILFAFIYSHGHSTWLNVNSGLQDELTCITFNSGTGIITGKKGAYQSSNTGINATDWARIETYLGANDSTVYNQSQFYGCIASTNTGKFFLCGKDTVNQVPIIFSFSTTTNVLQLEYSGNLNARLNKIAYYSSVGVYYAVGENGLLMKFTESGNFQVVNTGFNHNLNSISISFTKMIIGAENYIITSPAHPSSINFTTVQYNNRDFKDIIGLTNSGDYAAIANDFGRLTNNVYTEPHLYYSNELNGNDLFFYNGSTYIGTESGIFKSYGTTNVIEYMPTSGTHTVLSLANNNTRIFAVGKNGLILYTNNYGGYPAPYAQINTNGGCLNTNVQLTSTAGTVTSCNWSVDNNSVSGSCGSANYNATSTGSHSARLIFTNGSYTDTVYKTFQVVTTPIVTNPLLISDTILCHSQMIDITVQNSENNVFYILRKTGSQQTFGSSMPGNGNNVLLTSNSINAEGDYYLEASNNLASCTANFPPFSIVVERTLANFHVGLINAEQNEPTPFYQHCSEASNFLWSFSNQPDNPTSNLADPAVSFLENGQSIVKLIAWSDNGCYDSIEKPGPFIYETPTLTDSCYLMTIKAVNVPWQGGVNFDISQVVKLQNNGFVVTGYCDSSSFSSNIGVGHHANFSGMYVAKYSDTGVLKWIIKGSDGPISSLDWMIQFREHALKEDVNQNLYLVGQSTNNYSDEVYIIDNRGDTTRLSYSYILKFDSNGLIIWDRQLLEYNKHSFHSIDFDHQNKLYIAINHGYNQYNPEISPAVIYSGFNPLDTLTISQVPQLQFTSRGYVLKMDDNGNYLDHFMVQSDVALNPKILFDTENNMYLCAHYGVGGQIEIPSTGLLINMPYNSSFLGEHMYIVKFNSSGEYVWKVTGITDYTISQDPYLIRTCYFNDVKINQQGDLYLTGQNDYLASVPSSFMKIVNANGTSSTFGGGKYFLTKINHNGMCEWINGIDSAENVLAQIEDYGYYIPQTTTLTSSNGALLELNDYGCQVFILTYDLEGNLLKVIESGTDVDQMGNLFDYQMSLNEISTNYYFWTSNYLDFSYSPQSTSYIYFNDSLPFPPNQVWGNRNHSGLISLFTPSCGIYHQPYFVSYDQHTVCSGSQYQFADGMIANVMDSVFYESLLTAVNGFDSLVRTTVYGHTFDPINITMSQNGLLANTNANSYQWVDCNANYLPIPHEDSSFFLPNQEGNYAVVVTFEGCVDTSACFYYDNTGFSDLILSSLSFYPNPAKTHLTIQSEITMNDWSAVLLTEDGRILKEIKLVDRVFELQLNCPAGTYFLDIQTKNNGHKVYKIVKI